MLYIFTLCADLYKICSILVRFFGFSCQISITTQYNLYKYLLIYKELKKSSPFVKYELNMHRNNIINYNYIKLMTNFSYWTNLMYKESVNFFYISYSIVSSINLITEIYKHMVVLVQMISSNYDKKCIYWNLTNL